MAHHLRLRLLHSEQLLGAGWVCGIRARSRVGRPRAFLRVFAADRPTLSATLGCLGEAADGRPPDRGCGLDLGHGAPDLGARRGEPLRMLPSTAAISLNIDGTDALAPALDEGAYRDVLACLCRGASATNREIVARSTSDPGRAGSCSPYPSRAARSTDSEQSGGLAKAVQSFDCVSVHCCYVLSSRCCHSAQNPTSSPQTIPPMPSFTSGPSRPNCPTAHGYPRSRSTRSPKNRPRCRCRRLRRRCLGRSHRRT